MSHPTIPLPLTRIAVAVDESACARHALRWAVDFGAATGAAVEAVHVYPRDLAWIDHDQDDEQLAYSRRSATAAGHRLLTQVLDQELDDPSAVETAVLLGDAARCLTAYAEDTDLLVLGSRGHGHLAGAVLGSVSQHCVEHATCPVVVVPPTTELPEGPPRLVEVGNAPTT